MGLSGRPAEHAARSHLQSLCPDTTHAIKDVIGPLFSNGISELIELRYWAYGKVRETGDGLQVSGASTRLRCALCTLRGVRPCVHVCGRVIAGCCHLLRLRAAEQTEQRLFPAVAQQPHHLCDGAPLTAALLRPGPQCQHGAMECKINRYLNCAQVGRGGWRVTGSGPFAPQDTSHGLGHLLETVFCAGVLCRPALIRLCASP